MPSKSLSPACRYLWRGGTQQRCLTADRRISNALIFFWSLRLKVYFTIQEAEIFSIAHLSITRHLFRKLKIAKFLSLLDCAPLLYQITFPKEFCVEQHNMYNSFLWLESASGLRPSVWCSSITLRHTTLGTTALDEASARSGNLYLKTLNTHKRHTSVL